MNTDLPQPKQKKESVKF